MKIVVNTGDQAMIKLVINNDDNTKFNAAAHQIAAVLNASGAKPMECILILGALITEVMHSNYPVEEHPKLASFFDETLRNILATTPID